MTDNNVRLVVDVPRELRTEVNIIAKKKGITVKKIVNDLLEEYVSENNEESFFDLLYFLLKLIVLKLFIAFANNVKLRILSATNLNFCKISLRDRQKFK